MKKIACILLAMALMICLVLPVCAEEIDLSALTWEELLDLKARITMEQLTRDEWQEVEVPQGVWVVGEDIPAGKWTVRCSYGNSVTISWGQYLDADGHGIDYFRGTNDSKNIKNVNGRLYQEGDATEYTFDAIDGYYVVINFSSATFTPFTGKPDLWFKK